MASGPYHSAPRYLSALFEVGTEAGLSDHELVGRFAARRGEHAEAAFAALVSRHGQMVLRVCRALLGDRHEAEDAFQATFLVLASRALDPIRRFGRVVAARGGAAGRLACAVERVASKTSRAEAHRNDQVLDRMRE